MYVIAQAMVGGMDFPVKVFSGRLKAFRKASGLKQADLAYELEVEEPTVSRWESGQFMPDDEKFSEICRILNRKPHEFFIPENVWQDALTKVIVSQQSFEGPAVEIAALILKLAQLKPVRRSLVLYLIFQDESFLESLPQEAYQRCQSLLKAL